MIGTANATTYKMKMVLSRSQSQLRSVFRKSGHRFVPEKGPFTVSRIRTQVLRGVLVRLYEVLLFREELCEDRCRQVKTPNFMT
jgi:hypothetical protein